MGNVQCCASGRFHEGKPPKKPKIKKKKYKGLSKKINGVSGGKGNGGVKVVTVAEDGSDRAAPEVAQTQAQTSPNEQTQVQSAASFPDSEADNADDSILRGESLAAARERFFSQVRL
jgi:hypothetical protein